MPTYSHTQLLFLCFILAILCQVAVGNDTIVSPEHIEGSTIVAAEGLIETCTQIPGLVLPDSGITAAHKEGFIEGSVSLPDIETGCNRRPTVPSLTTPYCFTATASNVTTAPSGNTCQPPPCPIGRGAYNVQPY